MNNGKVKYVYWQDGNLWIGYLKEYPDHLTQGEFQQELQENLKDFYKDLMSDGILIYLSI